MATKTSDVVSPSGRSINGFSVNGKRFGPKPGAKRKSKRAAAVKARAAGSVAKKVFKAKRKGVTINEAIAEANTRATPAPTRREMERQTHLGLYGEGPFNEDVGHPCGNEDVAVLHLNTGFVIVRADYLNALEADQDRLAVLNEQLRQIQALAPA